MEGLFAGAIGCAGSINFFDVCTFYFYFYFSLIARGADIWQHHRPLIRYCLMTQNFYISYPRGHQGPRMGS